MDEANTGLETDETTNENDLTLDNIEGDMDNEKENDVDNKLTSGASLYSSMTTYSIPTGNTYNLIYDKNGEDVEGDVPKDSNDYEFGESVTVMDSGTLYREGYDFIGWESEADVRTITGLVSPTVYDDLGFGDSFLELFDILVELREKNDPSIPAAASLRTVVLGKGTSGTGKFSLTNVPYGEYLLFIYRPGYLLRTMEVTVSESDPGTIGLKPEDGEIFERWPGDVNGDGTVDNLNLMINIQETNEMFPSSRYNASVDLNADGIIDSEDKDIILSYLDRDLLNYPGAIDYDYLSSLNDDFTLTKSQPTATSDFINGAAYAPGDEFKMPAANVTMYANWRIQSFTITFVANGGDPEPVQQTVNYQEKVSVPTAMVKEGYNFGGWYDSPDFSGNAWDFSTEITSNVILYAKWNVETTGGGNDGGEPTPELSPERTEGGDGTSFGATKLNPVTGDVNGHYLIDRVYSATTEKRKNSQERAR